MTACLQIVGARALPQVDGRRHDSVKLGRDTGMGVPRTASAASVAAWSTVLAAGSLMLTGCAATNQAAQPQRYQRFFLPPQRAQAQDQPVQAAFADPPRLGLYANEYPALPVKTTQIPRLSDTEF